MSNRDYHFSPKSISSQRRIAFAASAAAVLLFSLRITGSSWFLLVGGLALFLGITDYGRQCPLFLSIHHQIVRLQKKADHQEQ